MSGKTVALFAVAIALTCAAVGHAALVIPISYSMPNGYSGWYTYWDESYTPNGVNANSALLSGGKGDLTDGIVATQSWADVEGQQAPVYADFAGPYVGWYDVTPTITFSFAAPTQFNSIAVYFDDPIGNFGTVDQPGSVDISFDGGAFASYAISDKGSDGPDLETIPVNSVASSIQIRVNDNVRTGQPWIFLSEIQFDGGTGSNDNGQPGVVPEPTTFAIWGLLGGVGLLVQLRRNRKA